MSLSLGYKTHQKKVTETALSLIAEVVKDDTYNNKADITKNLLAFAKLSDECKKGIAKMVDKKDESADALIQKLEYFEYTRKNIAELEEWVSSHNAEQTVKIIEKMTSEDLAKSLIKEVYYGVNFEEQSGKGYLKRYLCSNVCIDALEGGRLRYLCDVTAKSQEDLFMKWLNKNESINIIEQSEKYGVIYEKIEGKRIKGELYVNPENKRVVAAEITIKYDE